MQYWNQNLDGHKQGKDPASCTSSPKMILNFFIANVIFQQFTITALYYTEVYKVLLHLGTNHHSQSREGVRAFSSQDLQELTLPQCKTEGLLQCFPGRVGREVAGLWRTVYKRLMLFLTIMVFICSMYILGEVIFVTFKVETSQSIDNYNTRNLNL